MNSSKRKVCIDPNLKFRMLKLHMLMKVKVLHIENYQQQLPQPHIQLALGSKDSMVSSTNRSHLSQTSILRKSGWKLPKLEVKKLSVEALIHTKPRWWNNIAAIKSKERSMIIILWKEEQLKSTHTNKV